MEKQNKIVQLYGYSVCLVTVITFLISMAALVGTLFDLSDPLHSGRFNGSPSLASFENYKMDVLKSQKEDKQESAYVPDDQTLHAMYEAAKADRIQQVRLNAHRQLTVNALLILVCIALFTTHWRWMRKVAREEA
ncbi:MAG: hypothetical protein A3F83_03665 [Candidatus Glassbacteria bacterium RIFCSPLOWO2_12_FULL_58_11]|uniref:Uncharacterized protein n=2 Tax=Candidatus Glassiibacteriota TaxID=1817805 RepID=A0A1F5YSW2_9BACT|nr:MAG: hypothetical protein A2Z86_05480 [Candidatus Glassbacteria bacterium GWA2_58_10]OGG03186.1 MAG: hypothetical protein A3F83_03665 [Candidatus Glassbacteria bacterium RIFCSPLOWO2_12_FULL_58_11]